MKTLFKLKTISLIIVGLLFIAGISFFGFNYYKDYQIQQSEEEKLIQENEKLRLEKEQEIKQNEQNLEIEKLKKEMEELKNKPPQIIIKETQPEKPQIIIKEVPSEEPKVVDLPSIIKEWRPRVAHISCEWRYSDMIKTYLKKAGSGLALKTDEDGIIILTNAHVITDEGRYSPWICNIKLPEDNNIFSASYGTGAFKTSYYDLDWGTIKISQPDEYITGLTSPSVRYCTTKASIGDSVVILGYPAIGSQVDITATEGIVSGYDGDYYITSAKVEQGNSGGVAILPKRNCYLGIPSFAEVGGIESLARILDANAFVGKK